MCEIYVIYNITTDTFRISKINRL